MFTGRVPELYAYRHHYTWWKRYKSMEQEWHRELEEEARQERTDLAAASRTDATEDA
jgi:hypothetical protein